MSIRNKFREEVITAINYLNDNGRYLVSVKRIRRVNKISSKDRSRINFYWRELLDLEKKGFLEKIKAGIFKILEKIEKDE